jgi:hypothetical protein
MMELANSVYSTVTTIEMLCDDSATTIQLYTRSILFDLFITWFTPIAEGDTIDDALY